MSDQEKIVKGLIPWTDKEFQEVNHFLYNLLQRPKDDWDLSRVPDRLPVSAFEPMGQVAKHLRKKYLNDLLFKAHFVRFNNIIRFLQEHKSELIDQDLLKDNRKVPLIKSHLIGALCEMAYTEERSNPEGFEEYVFSYSDVMKQIKKDL